MKVIDLLNKIANGEEVPKKLKYNDDIYEYDYDEKNYAYFFIDHYSYLFNGDITQILDDEVEILEEKKIPDEININLAYIDKEYLLDKEDVDRKINEIINRHNILVDKVSDYLKSKGE